MRVRRITAVTVDARGFVSSLYCEADRVWLTARDVVIELEVGFGRYVARLADTEVFIDDVQTAPGYEHLAAYRSGQVSNALHELAVR